GRITDIVAWRSRPSPQPSPNGERGHCRRSGEATRPGLRVPGQLEKKTGGRVHLPTAWPNGALVLRVPAWDRPGGKLHSDPGFFRSRHVTRCLVAPEADPLSHGSLHEIAL